jgi:iron complex transport system substrate-binding protein
MRDTDAITGEVIGAAIELHRKLGPALLESIYQATLAHSLTRRGLKVRQQARLDFVFEGVVFRKSLKVDLLVEESVVVELKSVEKLAPVHAKQVLTYLRLLDLEVGLLLNFGAPRLKDGIVRLVNRHQPSSASPLSVNNGRTEPYGDAMRDSPGP